MRRATAYLSEAHLPGKMMYPLVTELSEDAIRVAASCRVFKLARQTYYRWKKNPITWRELDEAYPANVLFDAHRDDPEFGYRLLIDVARVEYGEVMSDRTAWRIAASNGWWSVFENKRDKNGKVTLRHEGKLRHLGVRKTHGRKKVIMLIDTQEVTVIDVEANEVLSRHEINPEKNYWPDKQKSPGRWPGEFS